MIHRRRGKGAPGARGRDNSLCGKFGLSIPLNIFILEANSTLRTIDMIVDSTLKLSSDGCGNAGRTGVGFMSALGRDLFTRKLIE